MTNPAALALALLLGHEARITDEQWSEVGAMALMVQCLACKGEKCDQCDQQGWVMQYDLILRDVKSSVDTGNVTDSSQRVTGVCPACEAAARERDALNALCDRQADILSRVAVALRGPEPPLTRWGHHDLPERAAKAMRERDEWEAKYHTVHQHNTMLQEHDYELSVKAEELADLRARIEARLAFCEGSIERGGIIRAADEARWLRALLAEKEAK